MNGGDFMRAVPRVERFNRTDWGKMLLHPDATTANRRQSREWSDDDRAQIDRLAQYCKEAVEAKE